MADEEVYSPEEFAKCAKLRGLVPWNGINIARRWANAQKAPLVESDFIRFYHEIDIDPPRVKLEVADPDTIHYRAGWDFDRRIKREQAITDAFQMEWERKQNDADGNSGERENRTDDG